MIILPSYGGRVVEQVIRGFLNILLLGQSNARGKFIANDYGGAYAMPRVDIPCWFFLYPDGSPGAPYSSTAFEALDGPGGSAIRNVGPEVNFMIDLHDTFGRTDLRLHKVVRGGAAIEEWLPADEDMWFELLNSYAVMRKATGYGPDLVVWVQGESDATTEIRANAYNARWTSLVSNIRTAFGQPRLQFIDCRLSANTSTIIMPWRDTVNAAKDAVAAADDYIETLNTDAFGIQVDGVHYTLGGFEDLGQAIGVRANSLIS